MSDLDDLFALLDQAPIETATVAQGDFDMMMGLLDAPIPAAELAPPDEPEGADGTERKRRSRKRAKQRAIEHIAILDFETEPFDNVRKTRIFPFLAVLYSNNFEPVIIWEENETAFVDKVYNAILELPDRYTIYAHNGGKFDYMFLIKRLRGAVSFKGRGIMSAEIGNHELRDSFHIIPDRLANYKKDHIDYANMRKLKRAQYRQAIIDYCINDCKYLLEIASDFAKRFGLKLSIGQAAMSELRKHYKFEKISETTDAYLRDWFFGGRVECLAGRGRFKGPRKLYDVNSMYPFVMATYEHPIGSFYLSHTGDPTPDTFFLELTCDSKGAFVRKGENGETYAPHGRFRFKTTIHEYRVALKYNLISNIEIHLCVDCPKKTNFFKFIAPIYNERQHVKARLKRLKLEGKEDSEEWNEAVKDDMFLKFLLNNSWGKFAQNPRKYKEHWLTDPDETPSEHAEEFGDFPRYACDDYWIWERPSPSDRFNNVGTGASVTGAARSVLLDAMCNADDPIYCDTDSLICRELHNVKIHPTDLGAWDIEKELIDVVINGKKLYSYEEANSGKRITKSKGAGSIISVEQFEYFAKEDDYGNQLLSEDEISKLTKEYSWQNMILISEDAEITTRSKGVTLTKDGKQFYMDRRIRATAPSPLTGNDDGKSHLWNGAKAGEHASA